MLYYVIHHLQYYKLIVLTLLHSLVGHVGEYHQQGLLRDMSPSFLGGNGFFFLQQPTEALTIDYALIQ